MNERQSDPSVNVGFAGLRGRMIAIITSLVAATALTLGIAVVFAFDRAVEPEIENRTRLIGSIVRGEIQRAIELGIPIGTIGGLDSYLSDTLDEFEEVDRIAVTDAKGDQIATASRQQPSTGDNFFGFGAAAVFREQSFQLSILDGNRMVGTIEVEISTRFVKTQLRNIFLDIGVLALVAVLVAVELSLWVVVSSVGKPVDRMLRILGEQRDGFFLHQIRLGGIGGLSRIAARLNDHVADLTKRTTSLPQNLRDRFSDRIAIQEPVRLRLSDFNDIRLALFLFALGTEIASAFMPLFAKAAARPDWMRADIAAALPLIFYLGAIAAVAPFGSFLVRRFGARNLFLIAAPGAAVALVGLAFSTSILHVTFFQGLMAFFYALAAVAGQEYAVRAAQAKDRAKAVGAFMTVAYGGLFAGSALGGLIAGRFGYEVAFITGAILTVFSIFLGHSFMNGRAGDKLERTSDSGNKTQNGAPRFSWVTGRYLSLLLGVAVPMNITMVMFIWYLTPLMLSELGSGPAEIARVLVLYNVSFFLIGPTIARLADARPGPMVLLSLGALVSGVSLLSLTMWSGFWAVAVTVAGVGIGQVLMQTPIYATALRINGGSGPGIDALRLIERLGAIAGLGIAAVFLENIGSVTCLKFLGFAVLAGAASYVIVEIRQGTAKHEK